MKLSFKKIKTWAITVLCVFSVGLLQVPEAVSAEGYGITMSPLNDIIILKSGEKYTGSFLITNPVSNSAEYKYKVSVSPFYVDEEYSIYYQETEGLNQIVNWITTSTTSGVLPVGGHETINYTIDVPKDAPAGGQYAAIVVSSDDEQNAGQSDYVGLDLKQSIGMSYIIYAEIAGTTKHSGEVINTNVPNFMFDGNISAESTIKNTGNTHGTATYTLQIFPLFSSEEVFTNEEDPKKVPILPNRAFTNKTTWDQTPAMGIFNVKYTVEFEGVTTEVTKLVIKCPLWLLFIILFVIIALIIWIVIRIRTHKKSNKRAEVEA